MSVDEGIERTCEEMAAWDRARGVPATAYTMRVGDKIVGQCCVTDGFLSGLLVDEAFRGRGVAAAIIACAQQGHTRIRLACALRLIPFYQKFGFCEDGHCPPDGVYMLWTAAVGEQGKTTP